MDTHAPARRCSTRAVIPSLKVAERECLFHSTALQSPMNVPYDSHRAGQGAYVFTSVEPFPAMLTLSNLDEESISEKAHALAIRQQGKKRAYDDADIMAFNASHPSSDDEEEVASPTLNNTSTQT